MKKRYNNQGYPIDHIFGNGETHMFNTAIGMNSAKATKDKTIQIEDTPLGQRDKRDKPDKK